MGRRGINQEIATLLEGKALSVRLELNQDEQKSYKDAKTKRMSLVQFVLIDNFHQQKLLPGESLLVIAHELK